MLEFHSLRVAAVERIADDAVGVLLAVPPALRAAFAHEAGQYVTVRRRIAGREERRTYSIVTVPGAELIRLGIRVQPGGRMSGDLSSSLRPGELLDVGTPMGRFRTAIETARSRRYAAFAAGSGITPVLSLAAHILALEPRSRFTLVYGNRCTARTMFLEETLALKNRHIGRFAVHFVMSREPQHSEVLNGRLDGAKARELMRRIPGLGTADEYFLCGPGGMVGEIAAVLEDVNDDATVRIERFAAARDAVAATAPPTKPAAAPLATIAVTMDGRRRTFPMAPEDGSVLEAAERAGLELPFSCRSGICATCRARVVEGAAGMAHNIALADWEVAAGFILCCQARPTTDVLELSYDEK